jgi:phosphate starvation-inducible membrane PsiE
MKPKTLRFKIQDQINDSFLTTRELSTNYLWEELDSTLLFFLYYELEHIIQHSLSEELNEIKKH